MLILGSILFCKALHFQERSKQEQPYPIAWDVYGYYLYLPATFIYHDPGLENREWLERIRKQYKPSPTAYQYSAGKDNRQVIVYNIGYALIYAPGFFIAHALAPALGYEADGFSKPYQYSLELTALLFTLLGLWMFRKIALQFFSDKVTALLLLFVLLGTNYFYQVSYDGVMPHNILFALNCYILWYTLRWHAEYKLKQLVLLAFFIGLAAICRPTELLWVLVPLLWGVENKSGAMEKFRLFWSKKAQVVAAGIVLFLLVFIQLAYLKYATGYYRAFNLHSESFSFLDPYTYQFLFSYKKGWLLYTPIMFFGIVGFYFLYKQQKALWPALFLYFIINLYVVSSWECWWYAASFSQRPMVESYVLMLFPMGALLQWISEKSKLQKGLLFSIMSLLVLLSLFQTWQFTHYIIHPERMTEAYYWKVFGKTSIQPEDFQLLSVDRNRETMPTAEELARDYFKKEAFLEDFENPSETVGASSLVDSAAATGKRSYLTNEQNPYSPGFKMPYAELSTKSYLWVKASAMVYLTAPASESNSCMVMTTESKGKAIKYCSVEAAAAGIQPGKWTALELYMLTPEIRHKEDEVKVYFWNMGKQPVLVDHLQVELFEPKHDPR